MTVLRSGFRQVWLVAVIAVMAGHGSSVAVAQPRVPVNIESVPPGATVYVDSTETNPLGLTPIRSARIPRGHHTLIFKLARHEEGRLPVDIRRRRETFRIVLNPLGAISVTAGSDTASSAAVRVDGEVLGNVPFRMEIQPGRHLVQVEKEGYVTFSQWVQIAGGQALSLPVMLAPQAPSTGSLLVAGDVTGAPIMLDGEPKGVTPTVLEGIPAGEHDLEIRPEGSAPWSQRVRVIAGERVNVNPQLRATPAATGSLRIETDVPGATITLDGEPVGTAPVVKSAVPVGAHLVEARADGFPPVTKPVHVQAGQQHDLTIELARSSGTNIVVNANVEGATVFVDGEDRGSPPVVVPSPTPGTHAIVVRAPGYNEFRTTCQTGPGRKCEIRAVLDGEGTAVRVEANVSGAQLYLDRERVGPVPYEGVIPIGEHRLEVRADGHQSHVEHVNLEASEEPRVFRVVLVEEGELTEEERAQQAGERERLRTGATSHAAAPLPEDLAVLDVSVGWPYTLESRLNVGVLPWLEGGFAMRTFGRITEFEVRGKVGVRPLRQVSGAVQVKLGGGLGPNRDETNAERDASSDRRADLSHDANVFFMQIETVGTLHFSDQGAFNLWLGLDFHTDKYDWAGTDSNIVVTSEVPGFVDPALQTCMDNPDALDCEPDLIGVETREGRQNTARFRLGGSVDIVLNRYWNAWALLEGILAGDSRDVLGDIYGFGGEDTELYFRLGLTHKF